MKNSLFSKRRNSKISSDAPLWFRFFGGDHFSFFGLLVFLIYILPISKEPKVVFLIIIGICLALNGAIHFVVFDYKKSNQSD